MLRRATGVYVAVLLVGSLLPVQVLPLERHAAAEEPVSPVPEPRPEDPLKVSLGERLFGDPRLSLGNSRSCATCHDLGGNGATANVRDKALDGSDLPLNTSTVFNAALSFRLNWEGGFRTLEDQARALIENPRIMGGGIDDAVGKLKRDPEMVGRFRAAFGRDPDAAGLLGALAAFQRSLVTPGGRFDRWLGGDATALSDDEIEGYRQFKSLGCASCHQGVNVGGNLFQRHGIFHPLAAPEPAVLRVPSLRNVATTPPYFHDGSASTLDVAVRKMARAQLNSELTDRQAEVIVAFLRTLTGEFRGQPVGEPR
ncbi:cytochrome C peroxidase [Skermanella stibiiresistens SB22]|uniref:Cytochrome C peroxidase n=1 Tax=Skermanella stibiiresistens SB22 TaxID=1385369 RepID=W9GVQ3_9PROT|nr:cytochrome c peroxidase [Skermanella stibiiresistens]EWY36522.1 cytochrome C peroxidase [Skermanella stibiiresistens SB22]